MLSRITTFFGNKVPYSRNDPAQKQLLRNLFFYIAKGYHPLSSIKSIVEMTSYASKWQNCVFISSPITKRGFA
jgi:hypothetical protein